MGDHVVCSFFIIKTMSAILHDSRANLTRAWPTASTPFPTKKSSRNQIAHFIIMVLVKLWKVYKNISNTVLSKGSQ